MDKKGSLVANAMDQIIGDCGHAYDHTFKYPDCTGKFHYSDKTCEYDCLVSEFEFWSLTTVLGVRLPLSPHHLKPTGCSGLARAAPD